MHVKNITNHKCSAIVVSKLWNNLYVINIDKVTFRLLVTFLPTYFCGTITKILVQTFNTSETIQIAQFN